jgi:hypothetical protein
MAYIAILSVGKVVVKTSLASPVSKGILHWLLSFLLLDSIVKALVVNNSSFLLANFSFKSSLGCLNFFGIYLSSFVEYINVDEFAVVALFPFFLVVRVALWALPTIIWNCYWLIHNLWHE